MEGDCSDFVVTLLVVFVCVLLWDPSLVMMAVGNITAGVGGGGLLMMYLSARKSVFRPFRVLGFGFVGIRGGSGGFLGGIPSQIRWRILDSSIGLDIVHLTENIRTSVFLCWSGLEFFLRCVILCR